MFKNLNIKNSFKIENFKFKIKNSVLDLLFPKYCVDCGFEGEVLCANCAQKIIPVVLQVCPECHKLNEIGEYHKKCSKQKALKGIICAAYFEEGPIREMIHNFKYNGVTALGETLSDLMVIALARNSQISISSFQSNSNEQMFKNFQIENSLKTENCKIKNYVLTYVPLHWRRQAQRGYNQAEILARSIGEKLDIDVVSLLVKHKATKRQAELTGSNRRKNLSGVFSTKTGIAIKNKRIIIVDDVTTTGSTLDECAAALKSAGAKEVWGLVVARG